MANIILKEGQDYDKIKGLIKEICDKCETLVFKSFELKGFCNSDLSIDSYLVITYSSPLGSGEVLMDEGGRIFVTNENVETRYAHGLSVTAYDCNDSTLRKKIEHYKSARTEVITDELNVFCRQLYKEEEKAYREELREDILKELNTFIDDGIKKEEDSLSEEFKRSEGYKKPSLEDAFGYELAKDIEKLKKSLSNDEDEDFRDYVSDFEEQAKESGRKWFDEDLGHYRSGDKFLSTCYVFLRNLAASVLEEKRLPLDFFYDNTQCID